MKINKIVVQNDGYVHCRSGFYSAQDGLERGENYTFGLGINKLDGEIDSGIWAISYLLSMYKYRPKDFILFEAAEVSVNDSVMSLGDIAKYTCYMDRSYPLFASKKTVRRLITRGLSQNGLNYSADDIRDIFQMDEQRFERPLAGVGNEIFKAMAAIGFCHGKQVFCFPWLSRQRFEGYHGHMTDLMEILKSLNAIAIVPIGR